MTRDDEQRLLGMMARSRVGRLARRIAHAVGAAAAHSSLTHVVRQPPADARQGVRLGGLALATASVMHALLLALLPPATVGRVPIATTIISGVVGMCLMAWPHHVVAAWRSSRLRRAWQQVTGSAR